MQVSYAARPFTAWRSSFILVLDCILCLYELQLWIIGSYKHLCGSYIVFSDPLAEV